MKSKILLSFLFTFSFYILSSQVPQGFNYQAIARDGSNNVIPNQAMSARITLQTTLAGGTLLYQETHSVTTNQFGLMTFVVGNGTPVTGTFSAINWEAQPVFIKTEIQYPGPGYINMGTSQLQSVPYSMLAKDLEGPVNKLGITGTTTNVEEALFEVKNNIGQTIFAVYNEGVRVFVDDGAKGTKGGFAIGGFGTAKAPSQEYLRVTRDSTRVYVNPAVTKGNKGGFAIGGFAAVKGLPDNFLDLSKENYFIGHQSGYKNKTGKFNSFIGYQSGYSNIDGMYNTMIGFETGYTANASYNSFFGYQAGKSNTSGSYNSFVGYRSGTSNTTGSNNVFLGFSTGLSNTSGAGNVIIGNKSGYSNSSGNRNVFVGDSSGYNNTTASNNLFMGKKAGALNTIGYDNVYIGTEAGYNTQTGDANVFIGYQSGRSNLYANYNTFLGYKSGYTNSTGAENVFLGYQAGYSNVDGLRNVFIGYNAGLNNTSGTYNIFVGRQAGEANTTGTSNVFIGEGSGQSLPGGSINTFVGKGTGSNQTSGGFNVYIGGQSGIYKTAGNYNSFLGYHSGAYAAGDNNVLVGFQAGMGAIGSGNVLIGYQTGANFTGYNNTLAIDNSSTMTPLIYGDFGLNQLRFNGNTSINGSSSNQYYALEINLDANDTYGLVVYGSTYCSSGAWSGSDIRLKKNISPLNNALGSILKLNGVSYDWRTEEFPGMGFTNARQIGLIAQDVEKIIPELVNEGPNGYKSIDYSKITPVLIEAIKEQQNLINSQNDKLDSALKEIDYLKNEIEAIKALIKK